MPDSLAARNLLFGILAVELDFVTKDGLIAAMNAWLLDKSRLLSDLLREQDQLSAEELQHLFALVEVHLNRHGNDPQRSLTALSSVDLDLKQQLAVLADSDVHATMMQLNVARSDTMTADSCASVAQTAVTPSAGRYRILKPHARGGLGEVFVAEDTELGRQVALKQIQARHADDRASRGRFVLEAEVTGGLEHPGIVPVYGLGNYADGRPFYAMRFIQGDNLKDAIAKFHANAPRFDSLTFRELLGRFIDVCQAIAYAHSRGVLHRDLKPGNIMLGKYGETLVVDWGLAKTLNHNESTDGADRALKPLSGGESSATVAGHALGTPAYMPPEQAAGDWDRLGPASDVYSLGATLYELLTGKVPFESRMIDIVMEDVRAGRFSSPRRVIPDVPRPLEAVCLKAMALNPANRYGSALAMAADVEHWLADEPVTCYAAPWSDRARRWMRKHRTLVSGVAALGGTTLLALAVGLAAVEHQRKKVIAQEVETRKQRDLADENRQKAEIARDLANQRFSLALNAFDEMVFGMQSLMEKRSGTLGLRKELLAKARPGLEQLLHEAESVGGANHTLIWSHLRLGDVALKLGEVPAALAAYRRGHELAQRLAQDDPKNTLAQQDFSNASVLLGDVRLRLGDTAAARDAYRQSLDIIQRLVLSDPTNSQAQRDMSISFTKLGDVNILLGDAAAARDACRRGLEISQRLARDFPKNSRAQRDLSISFGRLGDLSLRLGDAGTARDAYRQGLAISQRLAEDDPKDTEAQRALAIAFDKLGDVNLRLGDVAAAGEAYHRGLDLKQPLAQADSLNAQAQRDLSISFEKLGDLNLLLGGPAAARDAFRQCLDINQRLAQVDPKDAQAQRGLSTLYDKLGAVNLQLGEIAAARDAYRKFFDLSLRLSQADPKNADAQSDLAISFDKLGDVDLKLDDPVAARNSYLQSLEIKQRLAAAAPKDTFAQRDLAISFSKLGDVNLRLCDAITGRDLHRRGLEIFQRLAQDDPKNANAQRDLSISSNKFGDVCLSLGDNAAARDAYRKSSDIAQRLAKADPKNVEAQFDLAYSHLALATMAVVEVEAREVLENSARGLAVLEPLNEAGKVRPVPVYREWHEELKRLHRLAEKIPQAIADADYAGKQPRAEVLPLLEARTRGLLKNGERDLTRKTISDIVERANGQAEYFFTAAQLMSATGDHSAAMPLLRQALTAKHSDWSALRMHRDFETLRKRDDFAELLWDLAEAAAPTNP